MQYLRDKEFRMIVLISACVAAISAAAGLFLMGRGAYTAAILPPVCAGVLLPVLWLAFTLRLLPPSGKAGGRHGSDASRRAGSEFYPVSGGRA